MAMDTLERLRQTLADQCGVAVGPTISSDATTDSVALVPLSLTRIGRTAGRRTVLDLRLRVLVIPVGPNALRTLERALCVLDGAPDFDSEPTELPAPTWTALGITARPAVVVRATVSIEVSVTTAPRVRRPMTVAIQLSRTLTGTLLGPGDVPLAFARIRVDGRDDHAYTDLHGRFELPVGRQPAAHRLHIEFKNHVLHAELSRDQIATGGPVMVRCDRLEP